MATEVFYLDISKIGRDFTGKKDVALLTNERAISESVLNILNTNTGERIMNPTFGINLDKYLFEPLDPITASFLRDEIEYGLTKFEPRIENIKVIVTPDEDTQSYNVELSYTIKVLSTQQNLEFQLNKVR